MSVVQVRIVWVVVLERLVHVCMRVRFTAVPSCIMTVAMMLIVHVRMRMCQRRVPVTMLVPLGEVEPNAYRHQQRGQPEQRGRRHGR